MTVPNNFPVYTMGSGWAANTPIIFLASAPTSSQINFPLGQVAIVQSTNAVYQLTSFTVSNGAQSATWTGIGGGAVELSTLTGDTGTAIPSAGNIKIAGTSNEITTAASGSTVTLSVPSTFNAPGSVTAATTLTATSGAITATNGNLVLGTAGNKLSITTGSNASIGQSVNMIGGTTTVSTTAVTANSLIFLTNGAPGGTIGTLSVGTITAGTSFVINSSSSSDTSKVNWWIVN